MPDLRQLFAAQMQMPTRLQNLGLGTNTQNIFSSLIPPFQKVSLLVLLLGSVRK